MTSMYISKDGDLDRLVANGDVALTQGLRKGHGERLEYNVTTGETLLMGTNSSEAEVSDGTQFTRGCFHSDCGGWREDRECLLRQERHIVVQDQELVSLQTVGISKAPKGRTVVRDVNVEVAQGEVVGLLGPNGAGKTTTFYMIVGLTRPDSGSVMLGSHNITDLPMYLRAKNGISYLPQEASVFRKLTVEANIMAILETLPLSAKERRDRLESLLEEFGIAHVRKSLADTLVGRRTTARGDCAVAGDFAEIYSSG